MIGIITGIVLGRIAEFHRPAPGTVEPAGEARIIEPQERRLPAIRGDHRKQRALAAGRPFRLFRRVGF